MISLYNHLTIQSYNPMKSQERNNNAKMTNILLLKKKNIYIYI